MRFKRFLAQLTLLFVSLSAFSQNMPPEWQKFTREDYYFSVRQETNRKKVKENEFLDYLLGLVRADLAKQIKITVRDEASLEKKSEDGHTSIAYSASSNFSTDVTLRFVETRTYYDKKKKEGYAIAWLSKAELQRIYNERAARIVSMLDASARAEQEGKLDVALKYVGLKKDQLQFMKKPKIDWEHGARVYEIKFYHGGFEYEFDVDCESGKILKFEKDWDD